MISTSYPARKDQVRQTARPTRSSEGTTRCSVCRLRRTLGVGRPNMAVPTFDKTLAVHMTVNATEPKAPGACWLSAPDPARVILLGLCMDAIYQWIVLKTFYPAEAVIVAMALAFFTPAKSSLSVVSSWKPPQSGRHCAREKP